MLHGKMIFEQSGPSYGDETTPYNVILKDENVRVRDFIRNMLEQRSDDWGYIYINKQKMLAYRKGAIIDQSSILDMFYHKKIKSIKAEGGWTRMDYYIKLEE